MEVDLDRIAKLGIDIATMTVVDTDNNAWEKNGDGWKEAPMPSGSSFGKANTDLLKILAITPMHPGYGIRPQTLASVGAAVDAYDGHIDWMISAHDNPFGKPYDNVTHQHNKARKMVMSWGYDALLSIESDMIVPEDTVTKLVALDTDIAYGLYVWRHKPQRWSAYTELKLFGGESVSLDYSGQGVRDSWGKVIDVAGCGMGCTLIKRHVFDTLKFRLLNGRHDWITDEYGEHLNAMGLDPYRDRREMVCDDYVLALDAQHYGFKQQCDLSLVCGHIDGDSVIWPDPEADKFFRIEGV